MTKPLCYQAIVTTYYGPTNFKSARLKAHASAGAIWQSWDSIEGHASDNDRHIALATKYAAQKGWVGTWYMGGLPNGDRVFVNAPRGDSADVAFTTKG